MEAADIGVDSPDAPGALPLLDVTVIIAAQLEPTSEEEGVREQRTLWKCEGEK